MAFDPIALASRVLKLESEAVAALAFSLKAQPAPFLGAVELLGACRGRVVVTGIGKSGAIGRKIASTLASTGTPSCFVHAAEALHGDLGMVAPGDVLLAVSYSGRSDELLAILPSVRALGVPVVALTGSPTSFLATHADYVLEASVAREACPHNLAPTSSTTAALALGDALAVVLMEKRGFAPTDFQKYHPGGTLGRGARLTVGDLMRTGERAAFCDHQATVRVALEKITRAGAGAALIVEARSGKLCGYLTDGDLRRLILGAGDARVLLESRVKDVMTRSPMVFSPTMSALDALHRLQEKHVDDAPVVDGNEIPVGWLDTQELLRAGLM